MKIVGLHAINEDDIFVPFKFNCNYCGAWFEIAPILRSLPYTCPKCRRGYILSFTQCRNRFNSDGSKSDALLEWLDEQAKR